jgi:7-cyano-7-deazaguanine reductase
MSFLPEDNLTQLGSRSEIPSNPHLAHLETIDLQARKCPMMVRLSTIEVTTLCPVTSQPDFGKLLIDYIPRTKLIESKSLKLFLGSFRNFNTFHEQCIDYITDRLFESLDPTWIRVAGLFHPRGGISITPVCTLGNIPDGIYIPDLRLQP